MAEEPLRRRSPILHPSRWPIVAGGLVVAVAAFQPWQTLVWSDFPPETITGMSGWDAPGMEMIVAWLATLIVAILPGVASSRLRLVQWLPAILGLVAGFMALEQYQRLAASGGPGRPPYTIEGGFWAAAVGAALVGLGGVATSILISLDMPPRPRTRPQPGAGPSAIVLILPPFIALLGGLVVGVAIATAVSPGLGPDAGVVAPAVVLVTTVIAALFIYSVLDAIRPHPREDRRRQARGGVDLPDLEPVRRQDRQP